ncbi:recombination protein NinG [Pseudomonas aestusnigri]|uniref:recombination protein NinG n=1 Tax=Halopseudomonas aestusnigri TaxID=857252 RepID=UPI001D18EB6A|nr:recombination protein NinG [Halopseudomonas aestusnigri]MCC4260798.1 recombination protein NinG [Halopseudomonas aestusnigri]
MKALSGKPKKCRAPGCENKFVPRDLREKWCSPECGVQIARVLQEKARQAKAKRERRESREAKQRLKTRADYAKEAQAAINRYVRLRDAHLGCISCDKPASWHGQWHCSHFRSVGAAPHLRFNLWNMHKACSICNNHLSGNIPGYRPALIDKIGQGRVDWLESNQEVARYSVEYLKRLKRIFSKKCRLLEARRIEV